MARISHCNCRKSLKILAVVVVVLYIKLWLTKIDDKYYLKSEEESVSDFQHAYDRHSKGSLKIISYNMWCNYLILPINHNYVERFQALVNGLNDVDIVFVQETFILRAGPFEFSNCASEMVDLMHSRGFKYKTNATDTVPYVFGQSTGVIIFSKIPLRSGSSEIFKNASLFEFANNKGFASAEVMVNEKKISLFTAHLDAHSQSARTHQLKQIVSAIRKHKSSVTIVGGDLNVNALDHKYKQEYSDLLYMMKSVGLKTAFPIPKSTHPDGCFDYLFVSSHVKIVEKKIINLMTENGKMVSDHFGMFMIIDLHNL